MLMIDCNAHPPQIFRLLLTHSIGPTEIHLRLFNVEHVWSEEGALSYVYDDRGELRRDTEGELVMKHVPGYVMSKSCPADFDFYFQIMKQIDVGKIVTMLGLVELEVDEISKEFSLNLRMNQKVGEGVDAALRVLREDVGVYRLMGEFGGLSPPMVFLTAQHSLNQIFPPSAPLPSLI